MKAFFVQIKCDLGKAYEVASALADAEIASKSTRPPAITTCSRSSTSTTRKTSDTSSTRRCRFSRYQGHVYGRHFPRLLTPVRHSPGPRQSLITVILRLPGF